MTKTWDSYSDGLGERLAAIHKTHNPRGGYQFTTTHGLSVHALEAALTEARYQLVTYRDANPRTITVQSITPGDGLDVWTLGYEEDK